MTGSVQDFVQKIRLGDPLRHERLTVVPLTREEESLAEYLTINEAIENDLAAVEEIDETGSVPEMKVRNRARLPLLIPDGTALVGSKQNRVVNLSILLDATSDTVIPVSCVEQGRWSRASPRSAPSGYSDKMLRMKMCEDASDSLKKSGKVKVSQSGVWCHVQAMLGSAKARSPSAAYHALFESEDVLAAYGKALGCPEGTCGAIVLLDDRVDVVDIFDKPATFEKVWPQILPSLAVGAAFGGDPVGKEKDPAAFLETAQRCEETLFEPVGIGTNVRLKADDLVGAALVNADEVLHLSLFATADSGRRQSL